jgi:putative glutamine amidotransferase
VIIPARFSQSASALRFQAEVNARKLIEALYAGGGEPLTVHPFAPEGFVEHTAIAERFDFADAVLLPGGGDILPTFYGGDDEHEELYDMDAEQDAFDLAVAQWAIETGRPILAICRGLQIANVTLGGTLVAHMQDPHRHVLSGLSLDPDSHLSVATGTQFITISCYHHQAIDRLGQGLRATAWSTDGIVEAVEMTEAADRWFLGLQWHPEDTAATDPAQQSIFSQFVAAGAAYQQHRP